MGKRALWWGVFGVAILACVLACASVQRSSSQCEHTESILRCVKYRSNYDGDTLTVDVPGLHPLVGKKISVRVLGIDTPEIKGKGRCEKERARQAKAFVEKRAKAARNIELRAIQRDKYFRIGADVYLDGTSLGPQLIAAGLAVPYDGGRKPSSQWCRP